MKASLWFGAPVMIGLVLSPGLSPQAASDGFIPIFDGKTLNGWHASPKTGHSRASQHKSGGR